MNSFSAAPTKPGVGFPAFFERIPRIALRDPLAKFLGAAADGVIEYGYADAVRLAGHSCPTVASAYWLTCRALSLLYPDSLPERGAIEVSLAATEDDGTAGVTAAVASLLTGAAQSGGFKGLGGRFARHGLLRFGQPQPLLLRYLRRDTGAYVDAEAHPRHVAADPGLYPLLTGALQGDADASELAEFGQRWQARVEKLMLEHGQDPEVFELRLTIPPARAVTHSATVTKLRCRP